MDPVMEPTALGAPRVDDADTSGAPSLTPDAAFAEIFAATYEPLQRYVGRRAAASDVDDVVAEALTVLWRRCSDVPDGMAVPYAYGIARRCLANHRRGAARRSRLVERLTGRARSGQAPGHAGPAPTPDAIADGDPALAAALATLSDDDREVLRLWAWEGLAPREIAVSLAITPNAASLRLHRAKARCSELLSVSGHDEPSGGHIEGGSTTESTP